MFSKKFKANCPYSNKRRQVKWHYQTIKGPPPDNPTAAPIDDFAKSECKPVQLKYKNATINHCNWNIFNNISIVSIETWYQQYFYDR